MKYKLIIFDLDGTLINSIEGLAYSMNNVLKMLKLPTHSIEEYKKYVGSGIKKLVSNALPEDYRSDKYISSCNELMIADYLSNWERNIYVYEGINKLLDELKAQKICIAINTNKIQSIAEIIVKKTFKKHEFISISGLNTSVSKKPDPTGANKIVEIADVLPSETIFLGDSEIDIMTAKNAGMYSVSALWGFRTKEDLTPYKPDAFIEQPLQLLEILKLSEDEIDVSRNKKTR